MKKYTGLFSTTGSYYVEIKARNKEEALDKFNDFNFGDAQIVEDQRESEFQEIVENVNL